MNATLLKAFHSLPPWARSAVATLRGLQLSSWRYGPETERLVVEALEREHWSPAHWKSYQEERLAFLLHRAATRVPYYREQWARRRRKGDRASWEMLDNWPVLGKESVRSRPRAFVADDCDVRTMFHDQTSGTTGKALDLWLSRETVRRWYALAEARWRRWYGVSRHDRWAILGGQLVTRVAQRKPPFWVWNAALKQLYMSSYHLAPDLVPYFLDALQRYQVRYILGYTSSLHALAQGANSWHRQGGLSLSVAVTNAEPVYGHQREDIARALGCPIRETYGMAETVAAASECEAARLHLWPEVGFIEVREGAAIPDGHAGDLVSTGLLNPDMPLIRYQTGDRAALAPMGSRCPCGRALPMLARLEGRADDVLYTRDGRRIGRLGPVFSANTQVREAQLIQERLDTLRLRYVPAPGFTAAIGKSIVERVRARMGDVTVILEEVPAIPRTSNGKFRMVINALPPEDQQQVLGR